MKTDQNSLIKCLLVQTPCLTENILHDDCNLAASSSSASATLKTGSKIFLPFLCFFLCMGQIFAGQPATLAPPTSLIQQKFLADRKKLAAIQSDPAVDNLRAPSPQPLRSEAPFAPLIITLNPKVEMSSMPSWGKTVTPPLIDQASSCIEITIPPLADQSEIENFALTVNFNDMGDGGPLIEKKNHQEKAPTLLCSGLGINGPAIGLNSRTIAIPADLALDGGKILVRHVGRFNQLHSIILRPGRTAMVAVFNANNLPAILDGANIIDEELANGTPLMTKKGDITHHAITRAELSAPIEQLNNTLEFAFEIAHRPDATLFRTEIQGIDLDAHIEVALNGTTIGPLNIAPFQLDAANLVSSTRDSTSKVSLQLAGWRSGYVYIPSYLWKKKTDDTSGQTPEVTTDSKNHLILILKEGPQSSGSTIHFKNTYLELLHKNKDINS